MSFDKCFICSNSERDPEFGYTCSKDLWEYFQLNGNGCPYFVNERFVKEIQDNKDSD